MVKSKNQPATTKAKKDYTNTSEIFDLWNNITELKRKSSEYYRIKENIDPDDDRYYEVSQEHSKICQKYVDQLFDLWRYARETGAKHSRGEKVEFGDYAGEIAELVPEFDQLGNFIKWNYSVMYKNEAGETEYRPLITPVPQGDVNILNSVILDDQPAEPEAIAPEPEPEQLSLLSTESPRDLGNDYLAFKANQLIDILNSFPREAIAVDNAFRTGGKSDPEIIIETNRGGLVMWMDDKMIFADSDDVERYFDSPMTIDLQPWVTTLDDHLYDLEFFFSKDTDPIRLEGRISDPPYEYQDTGDGRYEIFLIPAKGKGSTPCRLGFAWRDKEGWVADDILPAENSRRAIAYRMEQNRKNRLDAIQKEWDAITANVKVSTRKNSKSITESKSTVTTNKKPVTESKPAGKKTKAITESKPPAKKSKSAIKKTDRAIANSKKSITELKPTSVNSVITTNGKPQGCINWSAPAGGAKVPAGTKYPYYCYHEGGKLRRCYIGGGNQQATIAQSRVRAVEEAIAEAKSPDEIVKLIHELKRG